MTVPSGTPWRASAIVVDAVTLLLVVAFIPFAILAVGLPIALGVRFLLWIGQQL